MADTIANEHLAVLERFVTDNDDLLALEERVGRFNIFDALGVARAEVRHSNFLAWLLDPSESHGQGDLFLKAVLMDMFKHAPTSKRPLSAAHLDGADLHDAEVRREWRNLDLLISCTSRGFVVAIENKVDSGEHSDQLNRYEQTVRAEYPGLKPIFVFLTPDGDEASDEDWVPYSYADLHRVLSRVRTTAGGSLGVDVAAFLDHYLTLVRRQMMNDTEIDELCRRIYRNHRTAIDLIIERANVGGESVVTALTALVSSQTERWTVIETSKNDVAFVPNEWLTILPPIKSTRSTSQAVLRGWIACFLWCKDGYLEFSVWVLKTTNAEVQRRVTARLTSNPKEFGLSMPTRRTRYTNEWTPILEEKVDEWDPHADHDDQAIIDKAKKRLDAFLSTVPGITNAVRDALPE